MALWGSPASMRPHAGVSLGTRSSLLEQDDDVVAGVPGEHAKISFLARA
jgi:hypothetical protein